jgi:hypothetical protein
VVDECDRCSRIRIFAEIDTVRKDLLIREILIGYVGKAELLSGIEGGSRLPVRKIVMVAPA